MKYLFNPVKGARLIKYPWGNVFQLFGENVELYKKAIGTNGHNGVDLVSAFRTPILASTGMVVDFWDSPSGYGKHIKIMTEPNNNGNFYELVYGHLDEINPTLKKGDKVLDGQLIGYMGNTGFVISGNTPFWGNAPAGKGVHLHFGVRDCTLAQSENAVFNDVLKITVGYPTYTNGMFGYRDPMALLEADTALIQYASGFILSLLLSLQKKIQELMAKVGKIK